MPVTNETYFCIIDLVDKDHYWENDEIIKKEVFVCNCCGELIAAVDESDRAAFLDVRKAWGYFSKWDGCIHHFHICEKCYEKMIQSWLYPPDVAEQTELM